MAKKKLTSNQREELLDSLKGRFEKNMHRHRGIKWAGVQARLETQAEKLWSLQEMENTGGEPDVVGQDKKTGEYLFFDCAPESPPGRTSLCYDREALDSRKKHKPRNCAMDLAAAMGIELLTEEQYLELQQLGEFDTKSSSWLRTPAEVRRLGGAIFGDRRFGSPGIRLQTYCEAAFEFRVFVDAIATYDYVALPASPKIAILPGPPATWQAIIPTLIRAGDEFRLAVKSTGAPITSTGRS